MNSTCGPLTPSEIPEIRLQVPGWIYDLFNERIKCTIKSKEKVDVALVWMDTNLQMKLNEKGIFDFENYIPIIKMEYTIAGWNVCYSQGNFGDSMYSGYFTFSRYRPLAKESKF